MKKFLVLAFAVVSAAVAQASYLYWQTGTATEFNGHAITGYNLYATAGGESALVSGIMDAEGDLVGDMSASGGYAADSKYVVDVSSYADGNYSFYVEVIGYDASVFGEGNTGAIAVSETATYANLVQSGAIQTAGIALSIPQMWTGGAVSAPEPTSAILMLLGLAGLALKRRKI